jgi:hypothetical protein
MRQHPGLQPIRAEAPGYLPSMPVDVEVIAGQTSVQNLQLMPECELLGSDAEVGVPEGWTLTFPWGLSDLHSASPIRSFTDSPVGEYSNGENTAMILPPVDLSAISGVRLSFASRCDTEDNFDFGHVEYRIGAGPWTELWRCSGSPVWQPVELDLSEFSGQSDLQLRFRISSDGFQTQDGWYVDDIRLVGGSLSCPDQSQWDGFADGFED